MLHSQYRPFIKRIVSAPGLALILLACISIASGGVIFDNGGPDGFDGGSITGFVTAEDFTLASATTLNGLIFYGAANVNDVPSQFGGTIGFRFLTDSFGSPGTSIAVGSSSFVGVFNNFTQNFGTDEYKFFVNLGGVTLGPGTYWIAIHEGAMGAPDDGTPIFFDTTSSINGAAANFTTDLTGISGYNASFLDLSFQLLDTDAIPEPGSSTLFVLGALTLLSARKLLPQR